MDIEINIGDLRKTETCFVSPILGYKFLLKFKNRDTILFWCDDITYVEDLKYAVDDLWERLGGISHDSE